MNNPKTEWGASPKSQDFGDYQVIEPVRDLAVRAVRPGNKKDVDKMLAAAEEQLANMRSEFPVWMAAEVQELENAWSNYKSGAATGRELLFRRMHDIRGQSATFGYPLAGRAADIMCKLFDAVGDVPNHIIETHIQTIKVIVRENVNTTDHPLGVPMIAGLEKLSSKLVKERLDAARGIQA